MRINVNPLFSLEAYLHGAIGNCLIALFLFAGFTGSRAQTPDTNITHPSILTNYKELVRVDIALSIRNGMSTWTAPAHFGWKEWTITTLCAGATGSCLLFDQSVRTYSLSRKTPARDHAILPWEYYGSGYTAVALGSGMYVYGLGSSNFWWRETGRELLTALVVTGATGEVLKIGFGRFRPYTNKGANTFDPMKIGEETSSLPSGHAMTAFVVSSVLAERINNPFVSCGLYGFALLTGAERVYSDNHWLSDVVLGALLGTAIGRFVVHDDTPGIQSGNKLSWKIGPEITPSSAGVAFKITF